MATGNSLSTSTAANAVTVGGLGGPNTSGSSSNNGNKRWRYYKLSPSRKALMYGDFAEKYPAVLKSCDTLPNKVDLAEVVEIKSFSRKPSTLSNMITETTSSLSFALFADNNLPLAEFICSSSAQSSEWKDGFSMLLDKGITSKDTAEYLHSLTEIGVKVKLLQIAGDRIEVPHGQIDVPPVPAGLGSGFYYTTD